MRSPERAAGLRLIIGYKWGKTILQLIAAALVFYGARRGLGAWLTSMAIELRAHAVHAWSEALASALLRVVGRPHDLILVATALAGDAAVSAVEGWVLFRGYSWGSWVVIGATGSILPFEIVALARRWRLGRVILLAVNVAVVVYLVWRTLARITRARHRKVPGTHRKVPGTVS